MIMALFSSAMSSDPVVTIITEMDNGREIVVPLDSVIEVKLETRLSTGYSWNVVEFNAQLLEFLEDSVVRTPGERLVGTKEHHLFRFRTKAKGCTALKMNYHRQWEKTVPPLKTYEIKLEIN
jgi:inhibitor of cysteine peptidase